MIDPGGADRRAIDATMARLAAQCLRFASPLDNYLAHEVGASGFCVGIEELERALRLPGAILGINNRNLRDFSVSLQTTIALLPRIPAGRLVVTESGILAQRDVAQMRRHGVNAFLVGEAFMRAPEPGAALAALFD